MCGFFVGAYHGSVLVLKASIHLRTLIPSVERVCHLTFLVGVIGHCA